MPYTEMIVMVTAFAALALAAIHLTRLIGVAILHRTIRRAIDRDPSATEPLLERLSAPIENKGGDDRTATLLIAFGVAMVVASLVIGDTGWMHYVIAGAVFPLIIGTALWLRHYALNRSRRTDRAEQE
jgi:type IV secretory pathway VirB3-like protein